MTYFVVLVCTVGQCMWFVYVTTKVHFQGSQAYVKALEKVNLVTADERKNIHSGLEKVGFVT